MLSSALPPCLTTHPELTGQEGEKWGGGHLQGAAPLGSLLGAEAPVFPKEPRSLRLHREEMGPSRVSQELGAAGGLCPLLAVLPPFSLCSVLVEQHRISVSPPGSPMLPI